MRVAGLWRYPVKGMAGEALDEAEVGWHGLEGGGPEAAASRQRERGWGRLVERRRGVEGGGRGLEGESSIVA